MTTFESAGLVTAQRPRLAPLVAYLRANELSVTFVATLVLGMLFLAIAAFTIGATIGFLVTGVCLLAGGHWVTYLRTVKGDT